MRYLMIFLLLFGIAVSISQSTNAEEVPLGAVEEAQRGLEKWRKGALTNLELMERTYGFSEADLHHVQLGTPTVRYLIKSELMKTCKSGDDVLSAATINHYSFPVVVGNGIKAFIIVMHIDNNGESEYMYYGIGPGDEGYIDFMIFKRKYKKEEGFDVYFLSIDWPSKYFILVKDEKSKYFIAPVSELAISMLKSARNQLIPLSDVLPIICD